MKTKWFRRSWQIFLKYGPGLLIAGFIFGGFVILYNEDNWLGISALATLFLALGAFWAIWQTRDMQKSEKRERLLNEIIEWGLEVSRFNSVSSFTKYAEIEDIQKQRIMIAKDSMDSFTSLETRGKYIKQVALKLEYSLGNGVGEVIINIKERNKLLAKSMGIRSVPPLDEMLKIIEILRVNGETLDGLSDDAKKLLALGKNSKTLEQSVEKVIEKATEIKTKDIGKKEENMSKEGEATGSKEPTLKDIEEHLKRQDKQMAGTQWQWPFSLGVSAMAVGLTWVIATTPRTPGDFRSGLFVFFIGVVIALLSLFYWYRKKS